MQKSPLTIKQYGLLFLTAIAVSLISLFLYNSWSQPQFQGQLQLYETNLLLNAATWEDQSLDDDTKALVQQALLGKQPLLTARQQYQQGLRETEMRLEKKRQELENLQVQPFPNPQEQQRLQQEIASLQQSWQSLGLQLGLLHTQIGEVPQALALWQRVAEEAESTRGDAAVGLSGLWANPPYVEIDTEITLKTELSGWFRYQGLSRLYEIEGKDLELEKIQEKQGAIASRAIQKLLIVAGIQTLGIVLGCGLFLFAILQWLRQRQDSWLGKQSPWMPEVPWNWETILLVIVAGFFFIGQLIFPVVFRQILTLFAWTRGMGVRADAIIILCSYLVSSAGALSILYLGVSPFRPLPQGWFRLEGKWSAIGWGIGGFLVAIPVVLVVSLVNQALWQGQGGSNPILPLALEGNDPVAIACFVFTASVAAPVFEEIMFRGFLLPSLTRYVPLGLAITLSGLTFAIAHLSLSEVIPLTTLGMIMGLVYTRSGSLLAPILLHSLWNGNTLLSLFLLGSN